MPKISKKLFDKLSVQHTKLDWTAVVKTELGNDRRLRGFYTSDPDADPEVSGVEFLNVASVGELPVRAGNLAGFGSLRSATVKAAADLGTGAAILRLEGNGNAITFTLGLPGSGTEFILSNNPTGADNEGLAFAPGTGLGAPVLMDSGTGPLSPDIDPTIVVAARLCDWSSDARVVVGTLEFNHREPNMVMEHPWQAREFGDIKRFRTADDGHLVWGVGGDSYQFGGELLLANKVTNGEAEKPLQQVRIRARPDTAQRWANYPFKGGFDMATDTMAPPPHKFELLNGNGDIVDVIELYQYRDANNTPGSGWPVNDTRINQRWDITQNRKTPLNTVWTCRMLHFWQSNMPKVHGQLSHLVSGVDAPSRDPLNVIAFQSDTEQWPVVTDNYLANGLGTYRMAPKWPRAENTGYDTTAVDPYYLQPYRDNFITQALGYGFQPGSDGLHGWFSGPGGTRQYRAAFPTGLVTWASEPSGHRIHGNVPWRELANHWMLNYFNHGHHFYVDVNTGKGIKDRVADREGAVFRGSYYGNAPLANSDTKAIDLLAFTNQAHAHDGQPENPPLPYLDKNGNRLSNEWSRDLLHSYNNAAVGCYMTLSPGHAIEAGHSLASHMLCSRDIQPLQKQDFLVRSHAWHMWNFANAWIASNNHPEGFTMLEVEQMWAEHLEWVHDLIRPEYDAQNTVYGVSLKRFGIHLSAHSGGDGKCYYSPGGDLNSKVFYMGQVYMLMKQSGAYDKMRAYSPKCMWTIDTIQQCLTTYAVDMILDSAGRYDRYNGWRNYPDLSDPNGPGTYSFPLFDVGVAGMPATWNELYPAQGVDDWMHYPDGTVFDYNHPADDINTKHLRAQWLWLMKSHFADKNFPRLDEAIAKVDGWYASVEGAKNQYYWTYRFANFGKFNDPDYVGGPA